MPTIIELTEPELAELRACTKEIDNTAAVRLALREYLRLARRLQLKALPGQVSMEDNWQALEAAELEGRNGGSGSGTD